MPRLRALLLVGAVTISTGAAAQTNAGNAAAAQALFDEAKALMKAGRYDQACPKLEQSQRLDPGGGTLVALALCYEAQGRTASAWSDWNLAVSSARSEHRPDREKLALDHIRALELALPRVRVVVDSPAPGTEVRRDGAVVDPALWGTAVPVDPGEHPFEARAPGKKPWQSVVVVRPAASTVEVVVPHLEDEPAASTQPVTAPPAAVPAPAPASTTAIGAPPATTPPAPVPAPAASQVPQGASGPSTLRPWSYVVGGAGVASLAVGAGLVAAASSKWSDAHKNCGGDLCTDPAFVREGADAGNLADLATGFLVAGALGAAAGAVLFVVSGGRAAPTTGAIRVTPVVGSTSGIVVGGAL